LFSLLRCGFPAFAETNVTFSLRYARIYERELAGERSGLVQDYRALFITARQSDKELAEKILYRIGVCEKKAGRVEQARSAWRELIGIFPLSDPIVSSARDALKALEWDLDRIVISGTVLSSSATGLLPVSKCVVFAGEWGNESSVLTGSNGCFRVGRRAAGQLPDGRSYGLIYAEHPVVSLVGAELWMSFGATNLTILLAAPISLAGWVVDRSGMPVPGLRVHVTGFFKSSADTSGVVSGIVSRTAFPVPLPLDRLIPPVYSSSNGTFIVEGLPAGLRYELTPETSDCHVVLKGDVYNFQGDNSGIAGSSNCFTNQQLSNLFVNVTWLRGNTETGGALTWDEMEGHVVVFHYGSAYEEASLRSQYPDEESELACLMDLYGEQGLLCLWILPQGEDRGEASQLALGLYPNLPVGAMRGEFRVDNRESRVASRGAGGSVNVVVGKAGRIVAICSDQQVFKAVKKALLDGQPPL